MIIRVEQQCHGYKNGHQLLAGSLRLSRSDQDAVDRLSDISGPLRPGETFEPYVSTYPLPSREFYVIAKTWQDLEAPRAGCVLTRSLFLNMSAWSTLEHPASIIRLLQPIEKSTPAAESTGFQTSQIFFKPIETPRAVSLVEALFLEERKPIVMYDEPECWTISLRLLSALWPTLRQTFSICTLALSPRSINGKSFDLMFASKQSRSRFTQWRGRVLDPLSSMSRAGVPRHRWSATTTEHIFVDNPPSLVSLDALGILVSSEGADEASLRLALLWNELIEKAESSPTAILGLLDILRSRGKVSSEDLARFVPMLLGGIDLAKVTLEVPVLLRFLLTLVGKFSSERPPISILRRLRSVLSLTASEHPQAVVDLYSDTALGRQLRSPLVTAAFGEGLSKAVTRSALLSLAPRLNPEDQLRLLAFSKEWVQAIASATAESDPVEWGSWMIPTIKYPNTDLSQRVRNRLVPYLSATNQAPLLEAMLQNADGQTAIAVAEEIRLGCNFAIRAFDEPLVQAARRNGVVVELRAVILKSSNLISSDRLLSGTMELNAEDVGWLLGQETLETERKANAVLMLIRKSSDADIRSLLQVELYSQPLRSLLQSLLPAAAMDVARLLLLGNYPTPSLLSEGVQLLRLIDGVTKDSLCRLLLERGLASRDDRDEATIQFLVSQSPAFVGARSVVNSALSRSGRQDLMTRNLKLLDLSDEAARHAFLNEIEVITDRIVGLPPREVSEHAIYSWMSLLTDAKGVNALAQGRSAAKALSFALQQKSQPYSALVVTTFPLVYAQLRIGKETPGLLSFLFTDWDRCKTARRDVTQAFLHSNWPAVDLLRAVAPTGDLDKVVSYLHKQKDGETFIRKLKSDFLALSASEQKQIEKVIGSYSGLFPPDSPRDCTDRDG